MAPIAAPTYLTNEYVNGETIAMAGASFVHNFIILDTATITNVNCLCKARLQTRQI